MAIAQLFISTDHINCAPIRFSKPGTFSVLSVYHLCLTNGLCTSDSTYDNIVYGKDEV